MSPMPSEQKSIRNLNEAEISFAIKKFISGIPACTALILCINGCAALLHWAAFSIKLIKTEDIRSHRSNDCQRIAIKTEPSQAPIRSLSRLGEYTESCLVFAMRILSSCTGKSLQSVFDVKRIFRSITAFHAISLFRILESWRKSGP